MAFKTFKPNREPVTLAELAERGPRTSIAVPRNAGQNRTASKRALLKAIKDVGGEW
jgi:hypothetical protein